MKYVKFIRFWVIEWWPAVIGIAIGYFVSPWILSPWIVGSFVYQIRLPISILMIGFLIVHELLHLDRYRDNKLWPTRVYLKIERFFEKLYIIV